MLVDADGRELPLLLAETAPLGISATLVGSIDSRSKQRIASGSFLIYKSFRSTLYNTYSTSRMIGPQWRLVPLIDLATMEISWASCEPSRASSRVQCDSVLGPGLVYLAQRCTHARWPVNNIDLKNDGSAMVAVSSIDLATMEMIISAVAV